MVEEITFDFGSMQSIGDQLNWKNEPYSATFEAGAGLRVIPKAKTDFYQRRYENPPADRSTGHALLYSIPTDGTIKGFTAETEFSIKTVDQYDQAGLMLYLDDRHWLKTGIEFENGEPKMSCVVTNGESDWSYLTSNSVKDVRMRLKVQCYEGVYGCLVEYQENGEWCFLRSAPMVCPSSGVKSCGVGVMCCAPKKETTEGGMDVVFKCLTIATQK